MMKEMSVKKKRLRKGAESGDGNDLEVLIAFKLVNFLTCKTILFVDVRRNLPSCEKKDEESLKRTIMMLLLSTLPRIQFL